MSPGLMQTLITTAKEMVNHVGAFDPAILSRLGISPIPTTNLGDFIRTHQDESGATVPGWLVVARQAIFAGIARLRWGYNGKKPGWELPLVCTNYNSGGHLDSGLRYGVVTNEPGTPPTPAAPPKPAKPGKRGYVDDAAGRIEIAVKHFAALPAGSPAPTVRLKK